MHIRVVSLRRCQVLEKIKHAKKQSNAVCHNEERCQNADVPVSPVTGDGTLAWPCSMATYINDWVVEAPTRQEAACHTDAVIHYLERFDFQINVKKSILRRTQPLL